MLVAGQCLLPVKSLLLCMLLLLAAGFDLWQRRIPNLLVLSGLLLAFYVQTALPLGGGFWRALAGLGVVGAIALPLYLLRAMGAGDMKLLAVVGTFLGPLDGLGALLGIFLVGGVMSLLYALRSRSVGLLAGNLNTMLRGMLVSAALGMKPEVGKPAQPLGYMPYGIAIAVGTAVYLYYANWLCL